jgi:hypothetical protein
MGKLLEKAFGITNLSLSSATHAAIARTTSHVQLLRRQDVLNAGSGALMIASSDLEP